jgi:hypothetical protein
MDSCVNLQKIHALDPPIEKGTAEAVPFLFDSV